MADSKRKKVGAGWARVSRDGQKKYISIVLNGGLSQDIQLVVFPNGYKEKDEQPDFIVYLNQPQAGSGGQAQADRPAKPAADDFFPGEEGGAGPETDDGIPF